MIDFEINSSEYSIAVSICYESDIMNNGSDNRYADIFISTEKRNITIYVIPDSEIVESVELQISDDYIKKNTLEYKLLIAKLIDWLY